jgi:hypothetical protein
MNRANEQRAPNLEALDEGGATRLLAGLATRLSPQAEYEIRHEDYVMEMPQSGERIQGRERMREFQSSCPNLPSIRMRRALVRSALWIVESIVDYGEGRVLHAAGILELKDGKAWRDTRYFAEPFEAPAWRARWVEKMGPEDEPAAPAGRSSGERRETDEGEVRRLMGRQLAMMRAGDYAGAHEWYDEAVVVDWPQSGERVRGKENLQALRQAYPAGVEFEVRRFVARPDLGVGEYTIRYDGGPVRVLAIVEFGGGKVVRETHYFAEPFEAPEWRARWVERIN